VQWPRAIPLETLRCTVVEAMLASLSWFESA
jgi:hypothetical protein